eukprot:c12221_g1_i2.p1 GENE.c12221_g1_i2~~c12221_g1_i2.p1  ORF type:complete len:507 (+),score=84.48 c12221_g1_i2:158-1522(+)
MDPPNRGFASSSHLPSLQDILQVSTSRDAATLPASTTTRTTSWPSLSITSGAHQHQDQLLTSYGPLPNQSTSSSSTRSDPVHPVFRDTVCLPPHSELALPPITSQLQSIPSFSSFFSSTALTSPHTHELQQLQVQHQQTGLLPSLSQVLSATNNTQPWSSSFPSSLHYSYPLPSDHRQTQDPHNLASFNLDQQHQHASKLQRTQNPPPPALSTQPKTSSSAPPPPPRPTTTTTLAASSTSKGTFEGRQAVPGRPGRRRIWPAIQRKHKCSWEDCDMCFPTTSELTCHMRTHTGERPYKCDVAGCNKAFAQSGGLVRHKRTHSGDRPYTCDFQGCGRCFVESGHLTRHMRSHTGEKPYICGFGCGLSFATSYHLLRHQRIHTGDKPYICTFEGCGKAFAQSGGLQRHRRTHARSSTNAEGRSGGNSNLKGIDDDDTIDDEDIDDEDTDDIDDATK